MFEPVAYRIKQAAKVLFVVGIILSIVAFIAIACTMSKAVALISLICLPIAFVGSWIGSLLLYGFGVLVEKAIKTATRTKDILIRLELASIDKAEAEKDEDADTVSCDS